MLELKVQKWNQPEHKDLSRARAEEPCHQDAMDRIDLECRFVAILSKIVNDLICRDGKGLTMFVKQLIVHIMMNQLQYSLLLS